MNDDISSVIGSIMQNPEALGSLIGSLKDSTVHEAPKTQTQPDLSALISRAGLNDDRRITLLTALRPYMSPARADSIDRAIRLLQLSKLSRIFRPEGD